ncbi:unnamed protein product [Cyprideis torosa]|uniref:Uncharacterized protein n=1 Tax=Cyprideis torosa TaxID=163714 RepID=A0A7R8W524_9CRUS|nr:unnamed protein product [Cyprideis torosa]CAG0880138.1 unnamed protein product [Cyprideis torosa]
MWTVVILSWCFLQLAQSLNLAKVPCGQVPISKNAFKIVGGTNTVRGQVPYIASLRYTRAGNSFHICGGTVINEKYILTAAHCVAGKLGNGLEVAIQEYNIREDEKDPVEEIIEIDQIFAHPDFRAFGRRIENDIALLKLKTDINFNDYVQPACLPDNNDNQFEGQTVTVSGWGATKEGGKSSNILQTLDLRAISKAACAFTLGIVLNIRESHMCASGSFWGGEDPCQGDSGGPLVLSNPDITVVGVVSAGVGCARPFFPGLYSRVSFFVPWIRQTLVENGDLA